MKKVHWKKKLIAFGLSVVMLLEFTPKEFLTVIAEEIGELVDNIQISQDSSDISYTLTDVGNLGTADIIQENVNHRTLTSKEYLMSDDIIMVRQFARPIHYYVDGQYKDIDDNSLELDVEDDSAEDLKSQENFESVNVFEGGETVAQDGLVSAGKHEDGQKSDLFLNFELPTMEAQYQLLGAKVKFEYKTQGAELFNGKDYSYNVYVAETKKSLEDITHEDKPAVKQTLEGINRSAQRKEKTFTYESEMINIHNIEDGIITLGIESTDKQSEDSYISIPTAVNDSMETVAFYQIVSGIKDEYSLETYEVDGATAYINNATWDLTVSCDLLSVNTLSDIPFESCLIYNSNYDKVLNELGKTASTGKNVKLNFQQYMIHDGGVYYYIDADGSISNFYSLGNGEYYSKEKKLYYTPDATVSGKGTVRDLLGNQMLFENGRLVRIVSSTSTSEYIKIDYFNNSDRVFTKAFMALMNEYEKVKPDTYPLFVFNPHPYEYDGVIEGEIFMLNPIQSETEGYELEITKDGAPVDFQIVKEDSNINFDRRKRVAIQAKLAPMSVTKFDIAAKKGKKFILDRTEQFAFDKAKFNPENGCLSSYTADGKEQLRGNAFMPIVFDDNEDPWGWGMQTVGTNYHAMQPKIVGRVVERGKIYTRLENVYVFGDSEVYVYYTVYANQTYVDVDVKVVWNEDGKGLKLAIPFANDGAFIGQTAFGTQTYEREREQCAQKFCGIDDGKNVLSVYANYIGGCSVENGTLYLTLFNGSVYCAHPIDDLPIVDDKRCNDYMEKGRHSFSFRLAFDKRESLEKNAIEFTQKPYALNGYPHGLGKTTRESIISLSNTNVALTSLRKTGENTWEVRLFNNTPQTTKCICRAFGQDLTLVFGKYEVKTLCSESNILLEKDFIIK